MQTNTAATPAPATITGRIQIERAGRRVLPSSPLHGSFWQLVLDGTVVGWATSHEAAEAKARRLERARGLHRDH